MCAWVCMGAGAACSSETGGTRTGSWPEGCSSQPLNQCIVSGKSSDGACDDHGSTCRSEAAASPGP